MAKLDTAKVVLENLEGTSFSPYVDPATVQELGTVKPDGSTINVDSEGTISVPKATANALGVVKPDNTTITISADGKLSAVQNTSAATYWYNGSTYTKKDLVISNTANKDTSSSSGHANDIWLFNTPAYPYIPLDITNKATSHTYNNGGLILSTSPINLTIGQGNAGLTFSSFVGLLPVPPGSVVSSSSNFYYIDY